MEAYSASKIASMQESYMGNPSNMKRLTINLEDEICRAEGYKNYIHKKHCKGFPIGISIGYFITILISLAMADGSYYPVAPKLEQICGSESYAAVLQFF